MSTAASRFDAATHEGITPLVGRAQEVGLLIERWRLAQEGDGQVVLLSGEPGIGKSRILSALREQLETVVSKTLRFQCSPYHVNSAYHPLTEQLERALAFGGDEPPASRLDKLEALVVGQNGLPRHYAQLLAPLLAIPTQDRYPALTTTLQRQKEDTLRALVDLTQAVARREPTLMLFEDAHWADPTSLEFLDLLIARAKNVPLLIVLTHRPEFQPAWVGHGHVTALALSRLGRAQSATLVSRLAGGKVLPAGLLEQIIDKTDGVPLFVEELTKSILESGAVQNLGDRYEYAVPTSALTIPATLRDSLMARLDRVLAVKEIAQIGAAIGREFSYELIAAVAPMDKAALDDALGRLVDTGLAFRRGVIPAGVYTFKHALVQDAAYDSLLKSRRQALHGRIARALEERCTGARDTEPELVAHHLTAAGTSAAAIPFWHKAGQLALQRMAVTEAISHLTQGLELLATLPESAARDADELDLRVLLGTAWIALKGWQAAEVWSNFHPALALANSLSRLQAILPIYWGLWSNVVARGRIAESLPWVQETLTVAATSGDPDLLIVGHMMAMVSYFWLGKLLTARAHGDKILALYRPEAHRHIANLINTDPKTVTGVYATHWTWMLGYPDQAVAVSDTKDAHARFRGHPFDLGYALTFGAHAFDYRYEAEALHIRADEAERVGRENSLPLLVTMAQTMKGIATLRAGRVPESVPLLRRALSDWDSTGGNVWSPYLKPVLAESMARDGDVTGALELIDESIRQIERPGWEGRVLLTEVLRLKAWMLQQQGKLREAEDYFGRAIEIAREQQAKSWELRAATSLARLWQSLGKAQEARALLAPIYGWFT